MTALSTIRERKDTKTLSIRERIESMSAAIERALPAGVDAETFLAAAVTEVRYNSDLRKIALNPATVESLFGAIFTCAQVGLVPGKTSGHAWLVPRWNKSLGANVCTFQLGYKGALKLARRTGKIGSVVAGHAFPGEIVDESTGIIGGEFVSDFVVRPHRPRPMLDMSPPDGPDDFDPAVVYYCLIEVTDAASVSASWTASEAFRHFERVNPTRTGKNGDTYRPRTAWTTDYPTMAAISVFRSAVRFLDTSTELDRALANENTVRTDLSPEAIDNATHAELSGLAEVDTPTGEHDD